MLQAVGSGIAAGGICGRYERWKEVAFQYVWLLAAADRDRYGSGQEDNLLSGAQG
jgi:oligopeptidase B